MWEGLPKGSAPFLMHTKEMITTTNQKYEITDIVHVQHPFLRRIRALRDIGQEVKAGDLGGFVESESNLSFEPGDDAWNFDNAIACNSAYVDKGSFLRGDSVASHNAYVSCGSVMRGHARAEDDAYIRGAVLINHARVSGCGMVLRSPDTHSAPILSGHCAVYSRVSGDVRLIGTALVISGEEIRNDTLDTLLISGKNRSVIRDSSRDELAPSPRQSEPQKKKVQTRGMNR